MTVFAREEQDLLRDVFAGQPQALDARVLQLLYQKRLFKLFVPDVMNGNLTALPQALQIFFECARLDGNLGWLVTIGSGGGYFVDYLPEAVARELFSPATAVLAGSGAPGHAVRCEGGIRVSGSWRYCSGAGYASFYTAGIMLDGRLQACVLQPEQIRIIRDWDAFGLQATESHSISCADALVQGEYVFDLEQPRGMRPEPIYRFPFIPFAQLSFAAVVLGLAQALLDEAAAFQDLQRHGNQQRRQFVQRLLTEAQRSITTVSAEFFALAETMWSIHIQGRLDQEQIAAIGAQARCVSATAAALSAQLVPYLGMTLLMQHSRLNYHYRNLLTANQHVVLKPF